MPTIRAGGLHPIHSRVCEPALCLAYQSYPSDGTIERDLERDLGSGHNSEELSSVASNG